jgi:dynein heavy chain 1
MFRIFSKFNALFVRPKIRGAIQEYQTRLIESVKEDIRMLRQKFTANYRHSQAYHMSQMRDFPAVSSAIIWAKQIERQLVTYMRRVEDVLGKGWEGYAEGHKLQVESASFKDKLNTRPLYDAWVAEINRRGNLTVNGRLFDVLRNRNTHQLQLAVQFDPQVVALFKEVRALIWLGFPVPLTISHRAKDAKRVYPHAVSLMESVRTYSQTCDVIEGESAILLASYRAAAQQMISKGMNMQWDHLVNAYDGRGESRHFVFVREFASTVSLLQDKTAALIDTLADIDKAVAELATCEYSSDAFSTLLGQIQKIVDHLNLENYSNLEVWVADLNARIDTVLKGRLEQAISTWRQAFDEEDGVETFVHEIRIRNQVIYLDPPIEYARQDWLYHLQDTLGVVCNLSRVRASRYEISLQVEESEAQTMISLLGMLDKDVLPGTIRLIESRLQEVTVYVDKWLRFQALWDLEADAVYHRIGDSLADWSRLLTDIRQARSTFDTTETTKSFGSCTIDYANAQNKVNAKYDAWQRDLLYKYGSKLGHLMKETYSAVLKSRTDLEVMSIEGSSTAQAVSFITFVQDLLRKVALWGPDIEQFGLGEKTLERQRYSFPGDWLYVDQVQSEWNAFSDILKRKDDSIKEQVGRSWQLMESNDSWTATQDCRRRQDCRWPHCRVYL